MFYAGPSPSVLVNQFRREAFGEDGSAEDMLVPSRMVERSNVCTYLGQVQRMFPRVKYPKSMKEARLAAITSDMKKKKQEFEQWQAKSFKTRIAEGKTENRRAEKSKQKPGHSGNFWNKVYLVLMI